MSNLKKEAGARVKVGSSQKDIQTVDVPQKQSSADVTNTLVMSEGDNMLNKTYLSKVQQKVKDYDVKIINAFRPHKKLLVLDIDYTIYDHKSPEATPQECMRPFLHEFLAEAYKAYDIVIWSATNMDLAKEKMKILGVPTNPNYKISCYLDGLAMIAINKEKNEWFWAKPLGVIWGKFPQFSNKNTIMIDDVSKNFVLNPQCGLKIKAFRSVRRHRSADTELIKIGGYLRKIARLNDFSTLDHKNWTVYLKRQASNNSGSN